MGHRRVRWQLGQKEPRLWREHAPSTTNREHSTGLVECQASYKLMLPPNLELACMGGRRPGAVHSGACGGRNSKAAHDRVGT